MPPDDLAAALLIPEPPEAQLPPQPSPQRPRAERMLCRLPAPFVRVPVFWFTTDPRPCPFGQRERLFLLLLHLSRWGQRPVTLTSAVAKEIGLSRQRRLQILKQLEAEGWIRVTRNGRRALVVCPIIVAD
jgi:hypothetical protein